MKTDDLIAALAADLPNKPTPVSRAVTIALGLSLPVSLAILVFFVHVRPGLVGMLGETKILVKFAFTLGLFGSGLWLALRLSRPGASAGAAGMALLGVFTMLAVAVVAELLRMPAGEWRQAMVGTYAVPCMTLIGLFSAAPLAALLYALRSGAPDSPALGGAVAGLCAGGLGAAVYATHCTEDSALFLALWYVIGISAVTVIGAILGRFALRW
jgi:hypothetical protein